MKKLIYITLLTSIFYTCNKDCENNNKTFYVYSSDLPFIIPYTDTSRVKFIKNGTDTLTYISQGLKETYFEGYISNTQSGGCGTNAKYERYSLKMQNSNDEFFQITINSNHNGSDNVIININDKDIYEGLYGTNYYVYNPPYLTGELLNSIKINNTLYTNVNKISFSSKDYILAKGKLGIIKFSINDEIYELIN